MNAEILQVCQTYIKAMLLQTIAMLVELPEN